MPRIEAEIVNKLGLHARAAAKLTQLAAKFAAEVWLSRNGRAGKRKGILAALCFARARATRASLKPAARTRKARSARGAGPIPSASGQKGRASVENGDD